MIKHFYSYHIEIDSIIIEIEALPINEHEKKHLIKLAESHVHHSILDNIMSELTIDDKKTFLKLLNTKDQEKIWKFLRSKINEIQDKILSMAENTKKELYEDIKEIKRRK